MLPERQTCFASKEYTIDCDASAPSVDFQIDGKTDEKRIVDEEAENPDDWDGEEDSEWVAW